MKKLTKFVVIGMVVLSVFLIVIMQSNAAPAITQPNKITATPRITATLPIPSKTPLPSPTGVAGKPLPQCTSSLSSVLAGQNDVSGVGSYIFAEPELVLTNDLSLRIVKWLSNEDVLVLKSLKPGRTLESIEILNINSGESVKLADGRFADVPVWNPAQKGIAYLQYNEDGKRWDLIWQEITRGKASRLESNVRLPILLLDSGKGAMAYSTSQRKLVGKQFLPTGEEMKWLDFENYDAPIPTPYEWLYKTAISPDTRWQAVYNIDHFLLYNSINNKIKEFTLGKWQNEYRWALDARWAPDGDLLAVRATAGRLPNPYSFLLIVDAENECMWEVPVSRPFNISHLAWSPGGRYLLLSGEVGTTQTGYPQIEYRLLDLATGQERKVNLWDAEMGGVYFDWSPDGKTVIINCATPERGALCTIAVEVEQ